MSAHAAGRTVMGAVPGWFLPLLLPPQQLPCLPAKNGSRNCCEYPSCRHAGAPSGGCSSTRGLYSTSWMRPSKV
jgi:hypothetical protein